MADVLGFAAAPSFVAEPVARGRDAAGTLALLVALSLAITLPIGALIELLARPPGFLPERTEPLPEQLGDLLMPLMFGPVIEELLFRGWMTGRIAALRFGLCGFAALGLLFADLLITGGGGWLTGAAVAAVFAGLLQWAWCSDADHAVPGWFVRRFGWFVWGSSLLFGLIHLGNFGVPAHPLAVLVVLPQAIGGLLLAYTRTRLGLTAAILHHAAYNAAVFGVPLALS